MYRHSTISKKSVKKIPGLKIWEREGSLASITTFTLSCRSKLSQGKMMVDLAYPSNESRLPDLIG